MSFDSYKTKIVPLCPVAIKIHPPQHEVHAPGHIDWGTVTCDKCGTRFAIGPNMIFGSRMTGEGAARQLTEMLARDHDARQDHKNSYELRD
jgi:hypothetical protein